MQTRRELLSSAASLAGSLLLPSCTFIGRTTEPAGIEVNDVQSKLNATRVNRIVTPGSIDDVIAALRAARREQRSVSISGGRHSMGGQQFGRDTILLDTTALRRVIAFDRARGLIEVEAGIQWPELIDYLQTDQAGAPAPWAIREKQTGVDRVCLGGSLSSNIHGRGLKHPPLIGDVESFVLVDAEGRLHTCSRNDNRELFALAIGGYGLFGVIVRVTLRLVPRTKVQRVVEVISVKDLLPWVETRLQQKFVFGDCQYSTDLQVDAESHPGVFSCYRPVPQEVPIKTEQRTLSGEEWARLYTLARTDKRRAFETYAAYYLSTSGQVYWSDTHQLAGSFDSYRDAVDLRKGTEMITEVYVPRDAFVAFLTQVRKDFRDYGVDMTYGTIRFIERDAESFLAWAREPSVCIVCNLHVVHTEEGRRRASADFQRIIDRVIQFGGRYFLTYHRWATRNQVQACYPQFAEFLRLKKKYDPHELFQSDWYRHYKAMFSDSV